MLILLAKKLLVIAALTVLLIGLSFGQCTADNAASDEEIGKLLDQSADAHKANQPEIALQLCRKVIELRPEIADGHVCSGLSLMKLKRYDEALASFQMLVKLEPKEPAGYVMQGVIYDELGQFEKSVPLYQKAVEVNPYNADAYAQLGMAYRKLNQFDEARKACQRAIELKPEWFSYLCLCEVDAFSNDYTNAVNSCDKSVKLHSFQYRGYSALAIAYLGLGQNEKAVESSKKALNYQPNSYADLYILGVAFNKLGRYEEAVEVLKHASQIRPDTVETYISLGIAFGYLGRLNEKIEALKKVVDLEPNNADVYSLLALTYLDLKEYNKAIEVCKEALKLGLRQLDFYGHLGLVYSEIKDYDSTITAYTKMVELAPNESKSYVNLGQAFYFANRYKDAVGALLAALEKNPNDSLALRWLGSTYVTMGEREKANEVFIRLIKIKPVDAEGFQNLAYAYEQMKRYDGAIDAYNKALSFNRNDFYLHGFLGQVYMKVKDYEKAIASFELAKQLNKDDEYIYKDLSSAYLALKRYDQSIAVLKEGIELKPGNHETYFKLADVYAKANLWENAKEAIQKGLTKKPDAIEDLGLVCMNWASQGRWQDCAKPIQDMLKVCQKNRDVICEGDVLLAIGYLNLLNHEDVSAEVNFNKALRIYEDIGSGAKQVLAVTALVYLYNWQTKPDKAKVALKKKLALSNEFGNSYSMVETLNYLAFYAENDDERKNYALQAVNLAKEQGMDEGIALYEAYWVLARMSYKNNDYISMWQFADKSERIAENSETLGFKARHEVEAGNGLNVLGEHEKAVARFTKAYLLASEVNYLPWQAAALCGLGRTKKMLGIISEAKYNYSKCVDSLEGVRARIQSPGTRRTFSENTESVYEDFITLLVASGEVEDAFNVTERAKARALLDTLGGASSLQLKGKNRIIQLRNLQGTILALEERLQGFTKRGDLRDDNRFMQIEKELETARAEYASLLDEIKQDSPEEYSLLSVSTLPLREVMSLLDPETSLLEYFVASDKTFVWAIDNANFQFTEIAIGGVELERRVNAYRDKIGTFDPDYQDDARTLYDLLLKPAMQHVKNKRIVIVPHAALSHLPFHALMTSENAEGDRKGRFLIEDFDVFYVPSASVLRFIYEKRKPLTGTILALGNPYLDERELDLPFAEEEVRRIKSVYPETTVFVKKQATKAKVQGSASSYNAVHFATHAELNADSPMSSSIRLAKEGASDGNLTVHEIFGLDFKNTSMVTLSGCETGLGKRVGGDEIVSLSRAFIYAGSPTIVASLWRVNDQSTAELMSLFYQNLKTNSKANALRKAQIEMIKGPAGKGIVRGVGGITTAKKSAVVKEPERTVDGSHPYFWAPFILIGDWK